MKKSTTVIVVVVILVIVVGVLIWQSQKGSSSQVGQAGTTASSTTVTSGTGTTGSTAVGGALVFDERATDNTIALSYPSSDFSLATNQNQILAKSYIPPCDGTFNYCLYYTGTAFKGTNFESAGIRVEKRADLAKETACLNTAPSGFATSTKPNSTDITSNPDIYATSVFSDVGDAAAGHTASGSLYRLYIKSSGSCYEFQTQIGQTQFANYPAGSVNEFTAADSNAMLMELRQVLSATSLVTGQSNLFQY